MLLRLVYIAYILRLSQSYTFSALNILNLCHRVCCPAAYGSCCGIIVETRNKMRAYNSFYVNVVMHN